MFQAKRLKSGLLHHGGDQPLLVTYSQVSPIEQLLEVVSVLTKTKAVSAIVQEAGDKRNILELLTSKIRPENEKMKRFPSPSPRYRT